MSKFQVKTSVTFESHYLDTISVSGGEGPFCFQITSRGGFSTFASICFTQPIVIEDGTHTPRTYTMRFTKLPKMAGFSYGTSFHKRKSKLNSLPGTVINSTGLYVPDKKLASYKIKRNGKIIPEKNTGNTSPVPVSIETDQSVRFSVKNISPGIDEIEYLIGEKSIISEMPKNDKLKREYYPMIGFFCKEKDTPLISVTLDYRITSGPLTPDAGTTPRPKKVLKRSENFLKRCRCSVNFIEQQEVEEIGSCLINEDTPTDLNDLEQEVSKEYFDAYKKCKKMVADRLLNESFEKVYGEIPVQYLVALALYMQSNISERLGEEKYRVLMKLITLGISHIANLVQFDKKSWLTCWKGCLLEENELVIGDKIGILEFVSMCNEKKLALKFVQNALVELSIRGNCKHAINPKDLTSFEDDDEVVLSPGLIFDVVDIKVLKDEESKKEITHIKLVESVDDSDKDGGVETIDDFRKPKVDMTGKDQKTVVVTSIMDLIKNMNGDEENGEGEDEMKEKKYASARFDFAALDGEEINLKIGQKVQVLKKVNEWTWVLNDDGVDGYVPTTYLIEEYD